MMTSAERAVQRLFSRTGKGIKFGLDKITQAALALGNPHTAYPSVHVAGTNGKGSTCAFTESILRRCGFRTGLFTSPHLTSFDERFIIDGRPVSTGEWLEVYERVESLIERLDLTFFEASTLIAFELFRRKQVDWAVFEVGMGGRLDATNIIAPRVSIISRIAHDHDEFLGHDLASIAGEKLGIVKRGVPLVMMQPVDEAVRLFAMYHCSLFAAPLGFVAEDAAKVKRRGARGTVVTFRRRRFDIPLLGAFQVRNAALALRAQEILGVASIAEMTDGIAQTFIPGRFQVVRIDGRNVVFDVAHNPDAAAELALTLKESIDGTICCVIGIMRDKDCRGVINALAGAACRFIVTRPSTPRAQEIGVLRDLAAETNVPCDSAPAVAGALDLAMAGDCETVCVTGSFFTVGEAMVHLGVQPYPNRTLPVS
jgi:dihydrofolate synthase/folylpolyglutamate synthase